jgi:hypothetical protein
MTFNPVLMIMQPREIDEAISSLKQNIDIPKVWFRAYTEPQVVEEMNKFIKKTEFSHYIVMSDDGVVSKRAADTILKYGEMKEYDVFTGWMNMHIESDGSLSPISTVSQGMLPKILDDNGPIRKEYPPWIPMKWVEKQEGVIQITMANFAMSIAERDIFLKFPLLTHPNGCSSDHHWSYRLQQARLKVWTHPKAFIKHLRRGWAPLEDNRLVGTIPAKTIYDKMWQPREFYK